MSSLMQSPQDAKERERTFLQEMATCEIPFKVKLGHPDKVKLSRFTKEDTEKSPEVPI